MSTDPDFAAAAAEASDTFSRLFPSPADVGAQIRDALARTQAIGGATGALATGLIEVLDVAHRWNVQATEDPDATISPQEAAGAVINAISRGLGS